MKILKKYKFIITINLIVCFLVLNTFCTKAMEKDLINATYTSKTTVMGDDEELTHLLFAKLAYDYLDDYEGENVSDYVRANPDLYKGEIWEDSSITYEGLYCEAVGDWQIYKVYNHNDTTGFYGVTFKKGNQIIIAFRGSEMFTEEFALDESNDWTGTDFKFAIMNELSKQFGDADAFYREVVASLALEGISMKEADITLTGHSLGGALVAYESIISDCYGYSFDGACGHVIDLIYMYTYLDIDGFTGVDDLDNIKFCNYTDDEGYVVADLIQHTNSYSMYQIDRETDLEGLNENTLIPKLADAGSHIIWSYVGHSDGQVYLNDKVNPNEYGYTYMPTEAVYIDINKNIIETGMENINFDTPWNLIDYGELDYGELLGVATGIIKDGRVVLGTKSDDILGSYDGVGITSAFDIDTVMYGGLGDDTLYGYVGDDVLLGGAGNNVLDGNLGNDTYVVDAYPDAETKIVDIGGDKTSIILRDIRVNNIKQLKLKDNKIHLGNNQFICVDVATSKENINFYTYNDGKLKYIGNMSRLGGKGSDVNKIDGNMSEFTEKDKKVVIFEGECTLEILDMDDNVVETISNSSVDDFNSTIFDFGIVYTNGIEGKESIFAVISDEYYVQVTNETRGNIGWALVESNNEFLLCDRVYQRQFDKFQPWLYSYSDGSQQGEVGLDDAIYSGVNFLFELFSN